MPAVATADWRRLDQPGGDSCTLFAEAGGWRIRGSAAFGDGDAAARLDYEIACDPGWRTRAASVDGTCGGQPVSLRLKQSGGRWVMNGAPQPQVSGLTDIDLFFTPATNLLPIRRLAPEPGRVQEVTAAWLGPGFVLAPLRQVYAAVADGVLGYAAPESGFQARLAVHPSGFVIDYPGLWSGAVRDG